MADQRIQHADGSTTIVDSHYGFGSINAGPPSRPEPPRVEDRNITDADVQKREGWTREELVRARVKFGFPKGHPSAGTAFRLWGQKVTNYTSVDEIEDWEASARTMGFLK